MYQPRQGNYIGLYEKALPASLSWAEKLQHVRDLGFDFIELSIDESEERRARLNWSDSEITTLRQLSVEYGVPLHSMCLSAHRKWAFGSADPVIRRQAAECMQQAITLAYKLGIRVIQLAGYDVYYEPSDGLSHQRFIAGMQYCAKLAEQAGVMLAVEIMDTPYLNSLSKFLILKREVPSPYFMAYPDVGNIYGWNHDVCTELHLARDYLVQIHLKDTRRVTTDYAGQFRDLVIGAGEVDFTAIFQTLQQIDYIGPLVIEMWAQDQQWRDNIVQALAHLRQCGAEF